MNDLGLDRTNFAKYQVRKSYKTQFFLLRVILLFVTYYIYMGVSGPSLVIESMCVS